MTLKTKQNVVLHSVGRAKVITKSGPVGKSLSRVRSEKVRNRLLCVDFIFYHWHFGCIM